MFLAGKVDNISVHLREFLDLLIPWKYWRIFVVDVWSEVIVKVIRVIVNGP